MSVSTIEYFIGFSFVGQARRGLQSDKHGRVEVRPWRLALASWKHLEARHNAFAVRMDRSRISTTVEGPNSCEQKAA